MVWKKIEKRRRFLYNEDGEKSMYTISNNTSNEIEIKKSRFITKLYKVYTKEEIDTILIQLRKEYSDATHICYAYKVLNITKFSDDGEPGGTAGLPMMEIINKNQLNYILAVVIRYFGGIKLGSGGLVRAYSKSVVETLKQTKKKGLAEGYQIKITCSYEKSKILDYQLKNIENIKKQYQELVTYILDVDIDFFKELKKWNPTILKQILIEKNPTKN